MIDPFDTALSEFIDTLPQDPQAAQELLDASAPFTGQGDLPAMAELATVLRSAPPYEPRPEWVAASKARLMSAPILPPERRGFTWLGSMFLPLTHLSWSSFSLPQLPQLVPSPMFARAAVALGIVFTLASVARDNQGQNPILQVTTSQAPIENAEQAVSSAQQEMARLAYQGQVAGVEVKGSPRDVVLLSKSFELAEEAIEKAPPAEQPRLRSQLQSSIRAVRFDGLLEGITNGSTLQVAGVAIQADAAVAQQLHVGQSVSVLVTVGSGGKLQAVQVAPNDPAPPSAPASPAPGASSPPATGGGTAPQSSSTNNETAAAASPAAVPAPSPQTSAPTRGRDAGGAVQTSSRVSSRSNNSPAVAVTEPTEPVIAAKVDKPDKSDNGDAPDPAPGSISVVAGAATSAPQASAAAAAAQAAAATAVQSAQAAASAQTAAGGAQASGSGPQSGGAQGAASAGSAGQAALQAAAAAQSRAQQAQSAAADRASQAVARTLQAREMPQLSVSIPSPSSDKNKAKDTKDIIKSKK